MPEQNLYSIKLLEKNQLTSDVLALRFERPKGFLFQAGQFVQFEIPDGEAMVRRSYSIASATDKEHLEFLVKIIPTGKGSLHFQALSLGESTLISMAKGVFVVKPEQKPKKIFIATGVGLAPIMSMLREMVTATPPVTGDDSGRVNKEFGSVKLLFGLRVPDNIFWLDQLDQLAQSSPNFSYEICLSRAEPATPYFGGRVSKKLTEVLDIAAEYYICGSLEMVKDVRTILVFNKVPMKQIHFEIF